MNSICTATFGLPRDVQPRQVVMPWMRSTEDVLARPEWVWATTEHGLSVMQCAPDGGPDADWYLLDEEGGGAEYSFLRAVPGGVVAGAATGSVLLLVWCGEGATGSDGTEPSKYHRAHIDITRLQRAPLQSLEVLSALHADEERWNELVLVCGFQARPAHLIHLTRAETPRMSAPIAYISRSVELVDGAVSVTCWAYDADADTIWGGAADGTVAAWHLRSGQCLCRLYHPLKTATALALFQRRLELFVGLNDGTVHLYIIGGRGAAEDQAPMRARHLTELETHQRTPVTDIRIAESHLLVGTQDGTVEVWYLAAGTREAALRDGVHLAAAAAAAPVRLIHVHRPFPYVITHGEGERCLRMWLLPSLLRAVLLERWGLEPIAGGGVKGWGEEGHERSDALAARSTLTPTPSPRSDSSTVVPASATTWHNTEPYQEQMRTLVQQCADLQQALSAAERARDQAVAAQEQQAHRVAARLATYSAALECGLQMVEEQLEELQEQFGCFRHLLEAFWSAEATAAPGHPEAEDAAVAPTEDSRELHRRADHALLAQAVESLGWRLQDARQHAQQSLRALERDLPPLAATIQAHLPGARIADVDAALSGHAPDSVRAALQREHLRADHARIEALEREHAEAVTRLHHDNASLAREVGRLQRAMERLLQQNEHLSGEHARLQEQLQRESERSARFRQQLTRATQVAASVAPHALSAQRLETR